MATCQRCKATTPAYSYKCETCKALPRKIPEGHGVTLRAQWRKVLTMQRDTDDCILYNEFGKKGYPRVSYRGKNYFASNFVCRKVHGEPPSPKHHAAHSCGRGVDGCINANHLSWKLPVDNTADRLDHGTYGRSLTKSEVMQIKRRLLDGDKQAAIARDFGVSRPMICKIATGRSWSKVKALGKLRTKN